MLIVAQKCGQLGNRLTLGAHLIALASEFGWRISYPAFEDYAPFFRGPSQHRMGFASNPKRCTAPWPTTNYPLVNFSGRLLRKAKLGNRVFDFLHIPGDDPPNNVDIAQPPYRHKIDSTFVTFLLGWRIRSYELVARHHEAIRAYYQPIDGIRDRVSKLLGDVRGSSRPLVGVHIRHGDYRDYLGGRHFLQTATYVQYMQRMRALLDNPAFLICSNEPQPPELFAPFDVRWGAGHLVEDMHALSQCDFILGVPSTFSHWAAFHGKRRLFVIDQIEPEAMTLDDFKQQGDYI